MGRASQRRRKGPAGSSAPAAPGPSAAAQQRAGTTRTDTSRTDADMDALLDELGTRVPEILDCRGLCYDSCTRIGLSSREQERIRERIGVTIPSAGLLDVLQPYAGERCPALSPVGRCSVYDIRPMLCRLYGASRDTGCEHGCTPARWLDPDEAWDLIAEASEISGDTERATLERKMAEALRDPEFLARYMRRRAAGSNGTLVHGLDVP